MINFNCFALSAVDDSVAETTQKAQAFFSRDNLTELFNEAVKWTADKIFQIILSIAYFLIKNCFFFIFHIGKESASENSSNQQKIFYDH